MPGTVSPVMKSERLPPSKNLLLGILRKVGLSRGGSTLSSTKGVGLHPRARFRPWRMRRRNIVPPFA